MGAAGRKRQRLSLLLTTMTTSDKDAGTVADVDEGYYYLPVDEDEDDEQEGNDNDDQDDEEFEYYNAEEGDFGVDENNDEAQPHVVVVPAKLRRAIPKASSALSNKLMAIGAATPPLFGATMTMIPPPPVIVLLLVMVSSTAFRGISSHVKKQRRDHRTIRKEYPMKNIDNKDERGENDAAVADADADGEEDTLDLDRPDIARSNQNMEEKSFKKSRMMIVMLLMRCLPVRFLRNRQDRRAVVDRTSGSLASTTKGDDIDVSEDDRIHESAVDDVHREEINSYPTSFAYDDDGYDRLRPEMVERGAATKEEMERLRCELDTLSQSHTDLAREYDASLRMLHEARMQLRKVMLQQQRQKERRTVDTTTEEGDGDDDRTTNSQLHAKIEASVRKELTSTLQTEMDSKRAYIERQLRKEMEIQIAQAEARVRDEMESDRQHDVDVAVADAVANAIRAERERSSIVIARMRQGAKVVLDRERQAMNDRVRKTTSQVREWVVRQQQEHLLKQAVVLQEEAERFGSGVGVGGKYGVGGGRSHGARGGGGRPMGGIQRQKH